MFDWKTYVRQNLSLNGVRPEGEAEIVDELAQQLEEAYREAQAHGLSDTEAETAARKHILDWKALSRDLQTSRRLASPALKKLDDRLGDATPSESRGAWLFAGLFRDVLFALRMVRKNPGFTAIAVLTLALGIAANTTIFSWLNAILLQPLPGTADPQRLVEVITLSKTESYTSMSYPDYSDFREQTTTLEGIVVHDMQAAALARHNDAAERIWVELASDNFFEVLGVKPILGRGFLPAEGRSPVPVVVISERLWRNRLGADRGLVGAMIEINRTPFTVVGVVPKEFISGYTGLAIDAWVPVQMSEKFIAGPNRIGMRGNHWLNTLARLRRGVSPAQAASELTTIAGGIQRARGDAVDSRMGVFPLWKSPRGAQSMLGPVLLVLMGVAAVILLITCANVAHLLLARATARRREFAVRMSIGCSRIRLVRQLVTETLVLVSGAAAAAAAAQMWTSGLLAWFLPPNDLPVALSSHMDVRIMAFTAALALASALLFGVAPVLQASNTDLTGTLKSDSVQGGIGRTWMRKVLLVAQLALSLLLLISASLFLRSLQNARSFDPGFKTDNLLLTSLDLFSAGYDRQRGSQALESILTQVRALPGVQAASIARRVPLSLAGGSSSTTLTPDGFQPAKGREAWAFLSWVGPEYFRTMRIPVLRGREFSTADRADRPETLVVNQTFAERYWPRQDPIGKGIGIGGKSHPVTAVVADSKFRSLNEPASPFVYLSTTWNYRPDVTLHLRTSADPMILAEPVRAIVRQVDRNIPLFGVLTLKDSIASASLQQKLPASLLTAFGALALLLASVGLYGAMAYSVSRRTRELGIRMALGATRGEIARLILGSALRITAAGIVIGTPLAAGTARLFSSLLFGVGPTDPGLFAAVIVLLGTIALIASYAPARRAARLDPLQALHYE